MLRCKSEINYPFTNCKRYSHSVPQMFIKHLQRARHVLAALRNYKNKRQPLLSKSITVQWGRDDYTQMIVLPDRLQYITISKV